MKTLTARKHCKVCGDMTKHEAQGGQTSHVFHLLMTLITVFFTGMPLWLVIWALCILSNMGRSTPWHCSVCGHKRPLQWLY